MLDYVPFPWQAQHVHARAEKRIILACGRRSGKTLGAGVMEAIKRILEPPVKVFGKIHAPLIYMGAPSYELAMRVWEEFEEATYHPAFAPLVEHRQKKRFIIDLRNGARAQAKTGDNPKTFQGERVTGAILDECQDMDEEVFTLLMPGLLDSGGTLIAFGIPRGSGRFRSMWELGDSNESTDAEGTGYYSASVPSSANPILNPTYIKEMKRDLTEIEFKQQILAEWAEAEGQVFHNVDECFTGGYEDYSEARGPYVMGLDLARKHDYTVAYVLDVSRMQIVHRYRVSGLDYDLVIPQVAEVYRRYHVQSVHMDATGVGEGVVPFLRRAGLSVSEFVFSGTSKGKLIATFNSEIEHGAVQFPPEDDQLRRELKLYESKISPSGVIQYSAPKGFYDDCVIAAALAVVKGMSRRPGGTHVVDYVSMKPATRRTAHARRRARLKRAL
jgi:hypothetical protein